MKIQKHNWSTVKNILQPQSHIQSLKALIDRLPATQPKPAALEAATVEVLDHAVTPAAHSDVTALNIVKV